jgi:iron complex transport system substrate-binding protein
MLLALGLEESIAGYAMQENEIPEKYKAAFDSLYCITEDWNVSQEMIMAMEPDFLMFWSGSPDYTYEFLTANGIGTYTMTSDLDGAKIRSVYDDFTNMGKIFGVEDRAEEIIAEMKAKIDPVAEKMADAEPVSVVYIDAYSSEEAAFTAGDALVADIFRTAGGENVINNTTDPWLNVSWEEIAAADPEWIVIGVYEGAEDADYWMDFLKNHPACSQMKAVQNENFIITGLVDLTVGERIADTVPMLAAKFHPES